MRQFLPHEKLKVYSETLAFAKFAVPVLGTWPAGAPVRQQLDRALESIVTNVVKAARLHRTEKGLYFLDCSLGSALECAACLDVALSRNLLDTPQLLVGKRVLQQVVRMTIGLRNSWSLDLSLHESEGIYECENTQFFAHETLEVYKRSLELHGVLAPFLSSGGKQHRYVRRMNQSSVGLTLNIAEGNGRFSLLDHSRFLEIAEDEGTKLAAYLDLAEVISG